MSGDNERKPTTCSSCGRPAPIQLVELTGKKYKVVELVELASTALLVPGWIAMLFIVTRETMPERQFYVALAAIVAGLLISLGGRVWGWWHHG